MVQIRLKSSKILDDINEIRLYFFDFCETFVSNLLMIYLIHHFSYLIAFSLQFFLQLFGFLLISEELELELVILVE